MGGSQFLDQEDAHGVFQYSPETNKHLNQSVTCLERNTSLQVCLTSFRLHDGPHIH